MVISCCRPKFNQNATWPWKFVWCCKLTHIFEKSASNTKWHNISSTFCQYFQLRTIWKSKTINYTSRPAMHSWFDETFLNSKCQVSMCWLKDQHKMMYLTSQWHVGSMHKKCLILGGKYTSQVCIFVCMLCSLQLIRSKMH